MGSISRPTSVQSVISFLPHTRKHIWHDRFHSRADSVLQVLQVSYLFGTHHVLDVTPEEKNQEQLNPSFWEAIGSLLPIHLFGNFSSNAAVTRSLL
jgi:hypothetical protein